MWFKILKCFQVNKETFFHQHGILGFFGNLNHLFFHISSMNGQTKPWDY